MRLQNPFAGVNTTGPDSEVLLVLAGPILQIADAKQELVRRFAREISKWGLQPLTVKLFGSAARGDMGDQSDVDLLVVLPDEVRFDEGFTVVGELTSRASRWTGNDVRPLLYRAGEIAAAPIFTAVIEEGIDVAGDPSWLPRRLRSLRTTLVHADAEP